MTKAASKIPGPGQQRPYPKPTKSGKAPFKDDNTGLKGETAWWLWGELSSNKVPLILLHGGPGIPHVYFGPISLIHEDYGIPVLMYDQIGCGDSTHLPETKGDEKIWTFQVFFDELNNLKTHLGIKEFDLLGHSSGAMWAADYILHDQSQGLRKLILADGVSSAKLWNKVQTRLRKQLPQDVQDTLDRLEKEGKFDSPEYEEACFVYYARHLCRLDPWPQEINKAFELMGQDPTVYSTMMGPSEFEVVGSLRDWSLTANLHKINEETVPGGVLISNGYYDEAQDEAQEEFWSLITARLRWVRYGLSAHLPFLEETEKYLADLGNFLTSK